MTTSQLPQDYVLQKAFGMVMVTYQFEVSKKHIIRQLFGDNQNADPHNEAMQILAKQAPVEANAIIGIQVATSVQQFSNGTFLYLTLTGTPVVVQQVS